MDKMTTIMVFHSLNVTVQLRTLCLHWSAINHHISICCNVHRRLVYLVCDGFLYSFCLLAESYETINHYYLIMEWSTLPEMAASQIHSWPLPFEKIENNIFLLILSN